MQIDELPDDVLLQIFEFCDISVGLWYEDRWEIEAWRSLVHVSRRWRSLVLESPRRLNLRLYCTPRTHTRDTLDVWPALPLILRGSITSSSDTYNTIAALEQSNRVRKVDLDLEDITDSQLEQVLAVTQVPFPELTYLRMWLYTNGETVPVIPDSFLDGSAPCLRHFNLGGIPFPGLPKLLLSSTHLVELKLDKIPHSGYISPEAMVTLLSVLSSLDTLYLKFQSPQSFPNRESPSLPPPKHSILPALDKFHFKGVTDYLEDLVTPIDAPRLNIMHITFFNEIDFDCPRLAQFIKRTPTLTPHDEAQVGFNVSEAHVVLGYRPSRTLFDNLRIEISCRGPDWQLSSIEQVCNSSLHRLSTVERLYIAPQYSHQAWKAIESTLWLQLLLPFTGVKNLYLYKECARGTIASALQELVGGRITEVLPSLQKIFVEWNAVTFFREDTEQFVAARELSGHPITISLWE